MKELIRKLVDVQERLVAKKGKQNKFGGFNYRTAESILAAVKPLLAEHGLFIMLSDVIETEGEGDKERFYLKTTVLITDGENQISNSAYARETLDKKGMDQAMITGAASSYARKYALAGMFGIDDEGLDPDRGHTKMMEAVDKKFAACKTQEDADKQLAQVKAAKVDKAVKDYAVEVHSKFKA